MKTLLVVKDEMKAAQVRGCFDGDVEVVGVGGMLAGRAYDRIIVSWLDTYASTMGADYVDQLRTHLFHDGKLVYI